MPVSVSEWPDSVPAQIESISLRSCSSSLKEKKNSLKNVSFLMMNHLDAEDIKWWGPSSLTGKTFFIFACYRTFKMR